MERTKRHRDFILRWDEAPENGKPQGHEWAIEVSSDRPKLQAKLAKLGPGPHRFTAETRERAMAEAVGFVDSLSLP